MRLLIFGAGGFIGSYLTRHAVSRGVDVVPLCRSGIVSGFCGKSYKWNFDDPLPSIVTAKADCAIHMAHDFDGETGAKLTLDSTLACVRKLRDYGVPRQIFFSSYSAGEHANSRYGRTKLAIENGLSGYPDIVIVRPGLVLGDGGIYGRIRNWVTRFPVIPLPDGGSGEVPVISVERLCKETLSIAADTDPDQIANLFEPRLQTLRQIVLDAARQAGRHPRVVPVPSWLILLGLRLTAFLPFPTPVNADNLSGFLANQQAQHISTLKEPTI